MRPNVRALIAVVTILLAAPALAGAQNGRSSTQQGSAPNGKPFAALQTQIDDLQQQIAEAGANDAAQDALISALGGAVLVLQSRMAAAEATLEELAAYDDFLAQWIAALEERVDDAEARLEQHQDSLQALVEADEALQLLIAVLEQYVDDQVADVDAEIDALRVALAAKQAAIAGACPSGSSIRQISATTGAVTCEPHTTSGGAGTLVVADFVDTFQAVPAGGVGTSTKVCPSGSVSTGGGYHKGLPGAVIIDVPVTNGWMVAVHNPTATPTSVRAFTRCATIATAP